MDVEVKVCKQCKKLFYAVGGAYLCEDCRKDQEEELKKVKDYIRSHDDQGVKEVSEACSVEPQKILHWVREDRLFFKDAARVMIPCMICGANISSGRYCAKCQQTVGEGFGSSGSSAKSANDQGSMKKSSNTKSDYISVKKI